MGMQGKRTASGALGASGVRIQYGALCWRRQKGAVEVLLITSRETGRWVIPKGWPMSGLPPEKAAAREAWEEAGVKGMVNPVCVGRFGYMKCLSPKSSVPCAVTVYALEVDNLAAKFPEAKERTRQWFSPVEAASLVDEADLGKLIAAFAPPPDGRAAPIGADDDDGPAL